MIEWIECSGGTNDGLMVRYIGQWMRLCKKLSMDELHRWAETSDGRCIDEQPTEEYELLTRRLPSGAEVSTYVLDGTQDEFMRRNS